MKTVLLASLIALPCLLAGPALADPSAAPPPINQAAPPPMDQATPPPASSAGSTTAADRQDYQRKANAEMHDWQAKISDFKQRVADKSAKVSVAARRDLRIAWRDTKVQARRLRQASADGWENAKQAFETTSAHLRESWDRADANNGKSDRQAQ